MKNTPDNVSTSDNIVSAQVIALNDNVITVKTEDSEIIKIKQPVSTQGDSLFLETMKDIVRSGLWIPVNRVMRIIMRYDWFDTPFEKYSYV
ncbi:hypothetical protein [Dellaglioa carnosa]|uniref:Uncharacterized protein n=1 Tax=Dellaglioa carnosa TaxID=2995136 RepID=A0ABT4JLB6_9LACO|nr:hypothetical protein [Dellaglioa carnosa]MCZ2490642.1 hypothetical protein [Dellaglioa carnosa]MCZ2493720.1 hypothetical protein [Dellaglioa carnosa]MDK1730584.1 hypothetical protein [Dellaglioa carnosa]